MSSVPATCGLPSQFMQLYTKTMEKQSLNSAGGVLEADLRLIELGGWMKVRGYVLIEDLALMRINFHNSQVKMVEFNGWLDAELLFVKTTPVYFRL